MREILLGEMKVSVNIIAISNESVGHIFTNFYS